MCQHCAARQKAIQDEILQLARLACFMQSEARACSQLYHQPRLPAALPFHAQIQLFARAHRHIKARIKCCQIQTRHRRADIGARPPAPFGAETRRCRQRFAERAQYQPARRFFRRRRESMKFLVAIDKSWRMLSPQLTRQPTH